MGTTSLVTHLTLTSCIERAVSSISQRQHTAKFTRRRSTHVCGVNDHQSGRQIELNTDDAVDVSDQQRPLLTATQLPPAVLTQLSPQWHNPTRWLPICLPAAASLAALAASQRHCHVIHLSNLYLTVVLIVNGSSITLSSKQSVSSLTNRSQHLLRSVLTPRRWQLGSSNLTLFERLRPSLSCAVRWLGSV